MAAGDLNTRFAKGENHTLIDAAVAVDNGQWIESLEFTEGSISVIIATTATVQIRGTDQPTKPTNAEHGLQIGSDITSSQLYSISQLPRWIKARVSAWTAGQVDVYSTLRRS